MDRKAEEMLQAYIEQSEQIEEENVIRAYDDDTCCGSQGADCCTLTCCLACQNM